MKKRRFSTQKGNPLVLRFFWGLVTIFACVGLAALLLSAFSDRISPQTFRFASYFGLFFPFILGFNVVFMLPWLLFGKWKQFLLMLCVIAICWGAIHN